MSVILMRVERAIQKEVLLNYLYAKVPSRDNSAESANPYVIRCKYYQISKFFVKLVYHPWISWFPYCCFIRASLLITKSDLQQIMFSQIDYSITKISEILLNDLPALVPKFGNLFRHHGINLTAQNFCTISETKTCMCWFQLMLHFSLLQHYILAGFGHNFRQFVGRNPITRYLSRGCLMLGVEALQFLIYFCFP